MFERLVWGAGGIGGPLGGRAGGRKENSCEDLFSSMEIRWMIGARRWSKMEAILASKGSEGVGGGGGLGSAMGLLWAERLARGVLVTSVKSRREVDEPSVVSISESSSDASVRLRLPSMELSLRGVGD